MPDKLRFCPKCNASAEFRLGEWECPSCGYVLPREQPRTTASAQPEERNDGINRAKLLIPAEPPSAPSYPSYQLRSVREPSEDPTKLHSEKLTFLTVWFVVTLIATLITSMRFFGALTVISSLPGAIVSALLSTIVISVAVYYDNDCLRQCSMWFIVAIVLSSLIAASLSLFSGMFAEALPLLPDAVLLAWLYTILWRDRRSED